MKTLTDLVNELQKLPGIAHLVITTGLDPDMVRLEARAGRTVTAKHVPIQLLLQACRQPDAPLIHELSEVLAEVQREDRL